MDPAQKRAHAEKVRRRVAYLLRPLGFDRTRPSFWTRSRPSVIEFLHLHLFSFAPQFRVHAGIRVLESDFDAIHLNGITSSPDNLLPAFELTEESVSACAKSVAAWCMGNAEPWFAAWQDEYQLRTAAGSPLTPDDRRALAHRGEGESSNVRRSRRLLGVG